MRITGVLSNFELLPTEGSSVTSEGERISIKNVGEVIPNPVSDKTKKRYGLTHGFTIHHALLILILLVDLHLH